MKAILVAIGVIVLAGCAGKQIKEEPREAQQVIAQPAMEKSQETKPKEISNGETSGLTQKSVVVSPLKDPSNILFKRSVYFDFDRYEIKPEYRALIEAHARYLLEHPKESVTLQGNADDRGSREYNLSDAKKIKRWLEQKAHKKIIKKS